MTQDVFPEDFSSLSKIPGVAYIFDFNVGDIKTRCIELINKHIIFVRANFQHPDFYQISIRGTPERPYWEHPEPIPRILLVWTLKNIISELAPPIESWFKRMIAYLKEFKVS